MNALEDEEFRGFVTSRGLALLRTAYLLTGDQQRAEDLVQTALEKTVRHWGSVRYSGAIESFVRTTMYREHISIWRRTKVDEVSVITLPEPRGGSTALADQVAERMDLRQALDTLGRRQRAVLVLRFYEDMTEQQVADTLGVSVGTVKSQTHKALAHLRSMRELEPSVRGDSR